MADAFSVYSPVIDPDENGCWRGMRIAAGERCIFSKGFTVAPMPTPTVSPILDYVQNRLVFSTPRDFVDGTPYIKETCTSDPAKVPDHSDVVFYSQVAPAPNTVYFVSHPDQASRDMQIVPATSTPVPVTLNLDPKTSFLTQTGDSLGPTIPYTYLNIPILSTSFPPFGMSGNISVIDRGAGLNQKTLHWLVEFDIALRFTHQSGPFSGYYNFYFSTDADPEPLPELGCSDSIQLATVTNYSTNGGIAHGRYKLTFRVSHPIGETFATRRLRFKPADPGESVAIMLLPGTAGSVKIQRQLTQPAV